MDFQDTAWGWWDLLMQERNVIAKALDKPPNDLHFIQQVTGCQWSFMCKGLRPRFVIQESYPRSSAVGGLNMKGLTERRSVRVRSWTTGEK